MSPSTLFSKARIPFQPNPFTNAYIRLQVYGKLVGTGLYSKGELGIAKECGDQRLKPHGDRNVVAGSTTNAVCRGFVIGLSRSTIPPGMVNVTDEGNPTHRTVK